MTRSETIKSILAARELILREAQSHFKGFVKYTKEDYDMQWFHSVICDKLNDFESGKISKMMILMPPQHGKSELATRLFPAYLLGKNPDRKIAITSYSDSMASGFNRSIQRYIDTEKYGKIFPDTKLNYSRIFHTNQDRYSRNEHLFEVVNKKGSVRSVGRGGSLTGNPVDIGIIDDLYKDRSEARSMQISQGAWDWYIDVFCTRLHNDSQQLIMSTRWDENDLCGRLLVEQPGQWTIIKFPALRTADVNEYDPRKLDDALWPGKHSKEKILEHKRLDIVSFNSLYQQDPKPNTDILVFPNWIEIPEWPMVDNGTAGKAKMAIDTWGLDFGKTTGINALIKCAFNGDNLYFEECCYEPGLSAEAIATILKANGYKGEPVYCDHQPTKIIALRTYGIRSTEAVKGDGSIDAGITMLSNMKCHYTKRSVNLKNELNKYQYVTYGKLVTRIPVDDFNHATDACRYAHYSKYFRGKKQ